MSTKGLLMAQTFASNVCGGIEIAYNRLQKWVGDTIPFSDRHHLLTGDSCRPSSMRQ